MRLGHFSGERIFTGKDAVGSPSVPVAGQCGAVYSRAIPIYRRRPRYEITLVEVTRAGRIEGS